MVIQICVGSSCHLKGSERIVELFRETVEQKHLENEIDLAGCFCTGNCNRVGVTIQADDEVFTNVTPENFSEFFEEKIMSKIQSKGEVGV